MSNTILVTYASRLGATAGVAEAIGKTLTDNGVVVGGADSWNALAWTDHAYAIWFPGEGPIIPKVTLPKGNWRVEWVDILSGEVTASIVTPKSWITTLNGTRRGGGVALRILRQAPASSN